MKNPSTSISFLASAAVLALVSACSSAPTNDVAEAPNMAPASANHAQYGYVRSIETVSVASRPTNHGGAVLGAVLGAVGGAVLGNKIERDRALKVTGYRVEVRMDNGDVRSFEQSQLNGLSVGSRVRADGGSLRPA